MYIRVRVFPGAKKQKVTKLEEHSYELVLREPAERNLANHKVREVIAQEYKVEKSRVRIVTGHHSPAKILELTQVTSEK